MQLLYGKYIGQVADHILDLIEARRQAGQFRRAFLIVPDARSLSLEQRYLERMEKGSLMRAEILSFGRLALRFAQEAALALPAALPAQSQALLLRELILKNTDHFPFLNPLTRKPGYLENLRVELGSLRRLGFDGAALSQMASIAADGQTDQSTASKLKEMAQLATDYDQALSSLGRRDGSADLDLLADLLESWADLDRLPWALENSAFYILGFGENRFFSFQEERVIRALDRLNDDVLVTCMADYLPADREAADRGAMAWRQGRRVLLHLSQTFPAAEIKRLAEHEPLLAPTVENLYEAAMAVDDTTPRAFVQLQSPLLAAENSRVLLEKVLGYIQNKVKNEAWRYKDFALCLCDSQAALRILPDLLRDFAVPAFIDERESLAQSRLFRELSAFMNVALSQFDLSECTSLLRLTASEEGLAAVDRFENFCLLLGLDHHKLFRKKYYEYTRDPEAADAVWNFAEQKLLPLKKCADDFRKGKTIAAAVEALTDYFLQSDTEARMKALYDQAMQSGEAEQARSISLSWNSLIALLKDNKALLPGGTVSAVEFRELLLRAAGSSFIGAVPSLLDEVYVGNPHTSLSQRPRQLILLNPGLLNFPGRSPRQGVLNDLDYLFLEQAGERHLPLSEADSPFEDSFFVQQLLCAGQEMPVIARSLQDQTLPHFLLRFLGLKSYGELDEALARAMSEQQSGRLFSKQWRAQAELRAKRGKPRVHAEDLRSLRVPESALLSVDSIYSASRLERFTACPYSYFVKYILGIAARREGRLDAAETGRLRHLLMEKLCARLLWPGGTHPDAAEAEAALRAVREQFETRALLTELRQMVASGEINDSYLEPGLFGKITRPILQAVEGSGQYVLEHFAEAKRWPVATEWQFGQNGRPPFILTDPADPDFAIKLRGQVDRIDRQLSPEGNIYSIVDYKSYSRSIDYFALWEGLDLQLPIYLMATQAHYGLTDHELGEASYFQLKRLAESLSREKNEDTLKTLESNLDLPLNDRQKILEKSRSKIVEAVAEIRAGHFPLRPRAPKGGSACAYCDARRLCSFDRPPSEAEILPESAKKAWLQMIHEGRNETQCGDAAEPGTAEFYTREED